MFHKEIFKLTDNINLIKLKKEKIFAITEIQALNIVQSMSKYDIISNEIIEVISEKNSQLVIKTTETLIKHKLILLFKSQLISF
ncbi:MAG: hypothetical protein ACFFHD_02635 [Promethearchaeota archaeon]